jgi:hypothetical protein
MQTQDVDQMLLNDLARLDRAIEGRKRRRTAKPSKKPLRCDARRYLVDVPIAVSSTSARMQPITRTVVIDRVCKAFRCRELVATTAAIGTMVDTDVATKISLPAFSRSLSYQWQVRDTYTDREWQNAFLPDLVLASGKNGGLQLGRPAVLPAGTLLEVTIMPIQTPTTVSYYMSGVTEYAVQLSFVGDEVYE